MKNAKIEAPKTIIFFNGYVFSDRLLSFSKESDLSQRFVQSNHIFNIIRVVSLFFALWITSVCFAKSALPGYEYDIVGVAIAKEGYYLVEVSAMVDKKKEATVDIAKKCAIHGCLFKGFAVERISQKPIMSSPSEAEEHSEYFDKLINEQFNTYTNSSHPIQIVKVDKRFRVKAIIVVAKESLRKDLEKAGIVRKLGF